MRGSWQIILSCEHAGNKVPQRYRKLFSADPNILQTHRAYDIGIAAIAEQVGDLLKCPFCRYDWTRLLIDVNRTHLGSLFSDFSRPLKQEDKQALIDLYYLPYRTQLEQRVRELCSANQILHLSMHSFTPVLKGITRNADIGILYDPARRQERQFAIELQNRLREQSGLRIRRNYPYRGSADGMTSWLRKKYPELRYLGIEIELNQALLISSESMQRIDLAKLLTEATQKTGYLIG